MSSSRKSRRLSLSTNVEPLSSPAQTRNSTKDASANQPLIASSQRLSISSASQSQTRRNCDEPEHQKPRVSVGHNRSLSQPRAPRPPGLFVKTLSKHFNHDEIFLSDDEYEELKDALSSALSSGDEEVVETEKKGQSSQGTDKLRPSMSGAVDLIYDNIPSPLSMEIVPPPEQSQPDIVEVHLIRRHSFTDLNSATFLEHHDPFNESGWYYLTMKTKAHERVRRAFWAWTIWIQARRISKFRYRISCAKIRRYRNTFIGVKMKEWSLRARLPPENRNQRQGRRSIQGQIQLSRSPRTLQEIKSFAKKLETLQVEMPIMMQIKIWQDSARILQSFITAYTKEIGSTNPITIQARHRLSMIRSKIISASDDDDQQLHGHRRFSIQLHKTS